MQLNLALPCLLCFIFSTTAFIPNDEITEENWDAITSGNTLFLMFYAPWCGHCKQDKPAWKKLMTLYKDRPDILVADVDCTGASEQLCIKHEIDFFPSYLFGSPDNLEMYDGDREFEVLVDFANEKLGPRCGYMFPDLCTEEQRHVLERFNAMPLGELKAAIDEKEELMRNMTEELKVFVEASQEKYSELYNSRKTQDDQLDPELEELLAKLQDEVDEKQEQLNEDKNAIKEGPLGLMKSVYAGRMKSNPEL